MRHLIDLVAQTPITEAVESKPEWFRWMFGTCMFNIELGRRMIETGKVKAEKVSVPVANCYLLLGLDQNEFGSQDFSDDFESGRGINPLSAIQSRTKMRDIPDDKYNEPALLVMLNSADIMSRVGLRLDKSAVAEQSKPSPVLIDGNHRLGRMYLEGVETAIVYKIEHDEALKFCFDRYMHPILRDASYKK